ncbi:MAG TPA: PAS domain S-box protein, partial [Smithellaceae bacterium]|nr:PAS domain S-box protein [Smithellaceae bacterium]
MPSYKKQMVFLILSFLVCLIFIVSLLREMQSQAVDVLNSRQRVYAKLTAKNISDFFTHQMAVLNHLAQTDEIIRLDAKGKAILQSFQATGNKYITGVSRVDARGKLLFTWPDVQGVSGRDISNQPHVQRILQTKQVTISDPFTAVQGYEGIALHAPVWRGQRFDGTVAFLISFADLAREHLGSLFIPNQRYTLLITADGKILQCNNPVHKGTSATDLYRSNLEALAMIDAMTAGKEGSASFVERQAGDDFNGRRVYAVYIPIQVGDRHWALAVVSSDDMLMPSSMGLKNRILILSAILLLIFAAIAYMAARIRTAAQEAQKRRQIEESLLVSAREIHDLYHNAPCGYHSLDSQGRIVRVNDTELTWLGYTRKELEGKSYVDLLSPESQKRFTEAFDRVKLCNLARDIEYDMIRKDESTFPVLVTASAVLDPDGRFLMTRSMVMDITERRRQEEQLRESETLYRTAMETTSDGITITQNRKYVYANKKLMETIGRPDEELTGKTAGVYIHADDRKFLEENFAAVSRGLPMPNPTYDIRVVKPDGSVVYVSVINVPITYHGKPATLAFIKDVTLQKQYEAALQESEKLYRTALEATSDGVTIVQNGIYAYVNQKFLDTMGVEREVIIDQPLGILAGPEAQDGLRAFLKRHPQADSAADINLTRVQKTDGSFIYFQSSSVDIIYRGKPAILTFIKDITESKKAEQALRESETLYRTALETTSDGILISDVAEAKYLYINQKLLDTLGRPHENLIGAPIDLYIHPDDVGLGKKYFLERKREGKKASYYESRLIKPDGDISLISITSTDIIFQGRKAVISFVQDITARKK